MVLRDVHSICGGSSKSTCWIRPFNQPDLAIVIIFTVLACLKARFRVLDGLFSLRWAHGMHFGGFLLTSARLRNCVAYTKNVGHE